MTLQKTNEGFTFVETLVALTVIALISIMLVFCYSTSIKTLNKTRSKTKNTFEVLTIDENFRRIIQSISLPEWESTYECSYTSSSLSLQWINQAEDSIQFDFDSSLFITNVEILKYKNSMPAGLKITYLYQDHEYICSELFSSIPYGQVEL